MKYSIIIPVFNAEKFLKRCLESIYKQEIEDYELLIFNDASTDNSKNIILEYKTRFKNKLLFIDSSKNRGAVYARKKLFKEASGNYIISIDADDYLESQALLEIDKIINRTECDLLIYEYNKIYESKFLGKIRRANKNFKQDLYFKKGENIKKIYKVFASGKINPLWRKVFRRELLMDFEKIYTDNQITLSDDFYLSQLIFRRANKIYYTNKGLYNYVKNKASITHSKKILDSFFSLIKVREYLDEWIDEWGIDKQKYFYNESLKSCIKLLEEISINEKESTVRKEQYKLITKNKFVIKMLNECMDRKIKKYFEDNIKIIEQKRYYLKLKRKFRDFLLK